MRVLAPDWHAAEIGSPCVSIEGGLAERHGRLVLRAAAIFGALRGLLIFRLSRGFDRVGLVQKSPGATTFAVLEGWLNRRRDRLVLLTFLPRELPARRGRRAAYRAWMAVVERPALRRSMRAAHVLTPAERALYASSYRLPEDRFRLIPWAFSRRGDPVEHDATERAGVVCSGRAYCDWETLFAAARIGNWELTVICSERDRERVEALNRGGRARVLCEISREQHDRLLRDRAVYALCLRDDRPSAGHVRLMAAVDAGLAVVASDVPGLQGYVEPGETALVVPPDDPELLASAVGLLLDDPGRRVELTQRGAERARHRTYEDLFRELGDLLAEDR